MKRAGVICQDENQLRSTWDCIVVIEFRMVCQILANKGSQVYRGGSFPRDRKIDSCIFNRGSEISANRAKKAWVKWHLSQTSRNLGQ